MAFWGDYHTHTVYSHGKGTIEENVIRAISIGLKEIAITDHGFRHMTYNVRRMDWGIVQKDVELVRKKYPMINIYLGLETNLSSRLGTADIYPSDYDSLDMIICGYHKLVYPTRISDYPMFFIPNLIGKSNSKMIKRNTDAYIKALERYKIDIFSHINSGIHADAVEVALAAKHFGTLVELNGKRIDMTDAEIEKMAENDVMFICDSDAHSVNRVGDFSRPMEVVNRLHLPYELIANWEKLPNFRSRQGIIDNIRKELK